MRTITYDRIRLESEIEITELGELTISMQGNHHARAFLTGRISEDTMTRRHEIMDSLVKINYLSEEAGTPVSLFVGLVQQVFYKNIQEENWVEIELVSVTIMLDQERKSRSFQK